VDAARRENPAPGKRFGHRRAAASTIELRIAQLVLLAVELPIVELEAGSASTISVARPLMT
jgi:hypothetical protein